MVANELRDSDTLARYGGDEFTVIASNTALKEAKVLAERIKKRIETHNFSTSAGTLEQLKIKLTVSIGVSSYGGSITSQESLIHTADRNLCVAKKQGRNKVVATHPKQSK